ncbi:MAG TPA: hypothetical protein VHK64_08610 [Nocardioidaceae bacterium]|jgi:hypothetical protein|nr:hypothetical protein [Nocardioidaceae bacterium]
MAGRSLAALDVNNRAAACVEQVWGALDQCNQFYKWLTDSNNTTAILTASPVNLPSADDTVIRSAISDLGSTTNGLWAVAHGIFVPAGTNNFFANAKKLSGVNYTG